jgi:hypothetical protein
MTRGRNDQGTKWPGDEMTRGRNNRGRKDRGRNVWGDKMTGTKWPGTKWKWTKCNATHLDTSYDVWTDKIWIDVIDDNSNLILRESICIDDNCANFSYFYFQSSIVYIISLYAMCRRDDKVLWNDCSPKMLAACNWLIRLDCFEIESRRSRGNHRIWRMSRWECGRWPG